MLELFKSQTSGTLNIYISIFYRESSKTDAINKLSSHFQPENTLIKIATDYHVTLHAILYLALSLKLHLDFYKLLIQDNRILYFHCQTPKYYDKDLANFLI